MRAVVQRVSRASVRVAGHTISEIGAGLLVLLSVGIDDDEGDAHAMAEKVAGLRIFPDDKGQMNCSLAASGGAVLLVSQFTLHGDARRGRRPSFVSAAKEPLARKLYELTGRTLQTMGIEIGYGEFGARMDVELVNAGPVTILLDTKRAF